MIKPTKFQQEILDAIAEGKTELIPYGGRRAMNGKWQILRIIWGIGTASSDTVLLQMGDAMHLEVYRSTLTTIFPGCVIAQNGMSLTISTQCVRTIIEKKEVDLLKNIDKAIQKSVAEYEKAHYNTDQQSSSANN